MTVTVPVEVPMARVPVKVAAMVPLSVMVAVADCNVIEDERASEAAVLPHEEQRQRRCCRGSHRPPGVTTRLSIGRRPLILRGGYPNRPQRMGSSQSVNQGSRTYRGARCCLIAWQ